MDILFLDIDGVLNSEQSAVFWNRHGKINGGLTPGRHSFCPIASSNFLSLFEFLPDLKIVVSSTWRLGRTVPELDQMMVELGLRPGTVIDKTPRFTVDGDGRGLEIQDWLRRHPKVRRFAIIDDDAADMPPLSRHLKHTSWRHGFLREDMHDLVHYYIHPWRFTNLYTVEQMGIRKLWDHYEDIFCDLNNEMVRVRYYGTGIPENLLDKTLNEWAIARFEKGSENHHSCFRKDPKDLMRFLGGDRGTSQSLEELTDADYQFDD